MSSDTPEVSVAQGAAPNKPRRRFHFPSPAADSPERIAARARRIRLERAINLICRTKCTVAVALRATGLDHDHNAREDVCDLLDRRNIPRIKRGVRRVRFKETPSRVFEEFIPRQETRNHFSLREMVRELRAIADPLGDDVLSVDQAALSETNKVSAAPKPPMICACSVCGRSFESKRLSRYCGGRCRIAHWRAQQ